MTNIPLSQLPLFRPPKKCLNLQNSASKQQTPKHRRSPRNEQRTTRYLPHDKTARVSRKAPHSLLSIVELNTVYVGFSSTQVSCFVIGNRYWLIDAVIMAGYRKLLSAFVVLVAVQGSTGYALWYHAPGHCSKQSEPVHDYLRDQEAPELEILPSTVYFYDCEGPPQTKAGYQLLFGCQLDGPVFGGCEENREYQQYQKVSPCDLNWAVYRKAYKPYSRAASGHSGAYWNDCLIWVEIKVLFFYVEAVSNRKKFSNFKWSSDLGVHCFLEIISLRNVVYMAEDRS